MENESCLEPKRWLVGFCRGRKEDRELWIFVACCRLGGEIPALSNRWILVIVFLVSTLIFASVCWIPFRCKFFNTKVWFFIFSSFCAVNWGLQEVTIVKNLRDLHEVTIVNHLNVSCGSSGLFFLFNLKLNLECYGSFGGGLCLFGLSDASSHLWNLSPFISCHLKVLVLQGWHVRPGPWPLKKLPG